MSTPPSKPRSANAILCGSLACVLALCCLAAGAADDKKSDREARRAQMLEQRLEQERAQWETERADLQKQLAQLQETVASTKTAQTTTAASLSKATSQVAAQGKQIDDLNRQIAEQKSSAERAQVDHRAELDRIAAARVQERNVQSAHLDASTKALSSCTDHNVRLLAIGHELLERVRNKGFVDVMKQEEPFLGIGDVEMFDLVQSYRDKIDTEREKPPAGTY